MLDLPAFRYWQFGTPSDKDALLLGPRPSSFGLSFARGTFTGEKAWVNTFVP